MPHFYILPHESDPITLDGRYAVVIPGRRLRPKDDGRFTARFLSDVLRQDDIQTRLQGLFGAQKQIGSAFAVFS